MRRPARSLQGRVTLIGTAVIAVLVLAFNLFVYLSLRDQLFSNLESVLDARAQLVVGLREDFTPEELSARLEEGGIRAVIRTADGELLRTAGAPALGMLPPAEPDEPLVGRTIPLGDGATATVLASRGGIDATLDRLLLLASTGTMVVVALAYALLSWLAARVMRPVRQLATTAGRIASGARDERLPPRQDDDELSDMVDAFNRMLDELALAIERSQQAEQLSRRFLADAAHQLRTPAASMRATVAALARTDSVDDRERMIDNLAQEAARMSRLLSSLLRVARLDSNEAPTVARTDLDREVRDWVAARAVRAPSRRFTVDSHGEVVAEVDRSALREAVDNLLDNATRHAKHRVHVRVHGAGTEAVIEVRDDGAGVAVEDRERIFKRFVSLDDGVGSGLGLPIARGIAEAHGGSLEYADGAFILRLPRSQPAGA